MKRSLYQLKLITPCFCTGSNPLVAEIRAASLRGEFRWWFRAVGGTSEQEKSIFGGVSDGVTSSCIRIRTLDFLKSDKSYQPTYIKAGEPSSYINYYLSASTDERASRLWDVQPDEKLKTKGKVREGSSIPYDSTFTLEIIKHRPIPKESQSLYDLALNCFLLFGSIGYRHTRGFGSWICADMLLPLSEIKKSFDPLLSLDSPFRAEWSESLATPDNVFNQIETRLKADKIAKTGMRLNHPAVLPTALGYSFKDVRQGSAVRFRPFEFKTKSEPQMKLLIFQAPDFLLSPEIKESHRTIKFK